MKKTNMKLMYLFYGVIFATTLQIKSAERQETGKNPYEGLGDESYAIHCQSGLPPSEAKKTKERLIFFMRLEGLPEGHPDQVLYFAYKQALFSPAVTQVERNRFEERINALQMKYKSEK